MAPEELLKLINKSVSETKITIPAIWLDQRNLKISIGYRKFLQLKLKQVLESPGKFADSKETHWTSSAVVYNLFARLFTAYDHDQDGRIGDSVSDMTCNAAGVRETGTFLKTIALLPYLKKMGVNTIHLLPITEIGMKGRKGDLGSPYAIKNPYKIDPLLADPEIPLSVEDQYKAFIDAAHFMGIRVVQEFIFRTAAMDSDWHLEHPEWFYWIKKKVNFGPPQFAKSELEQILRIPKGKGKFIPPHQSYRNLFEMPPNPGEQKNVKIASAFADWPPNDLQPPWSDVTYLRLYNYDFTAPNNFNYIAYNTIRFYDPELAREENKNHDLWDHITDIIPHYQNKFGIDGAMIDMGHALPPELKHRIITKAREIDPEFGFWDENFRNTEKTKTEGYNAVIGGAWHLITKKNGFSKLLSEMDKPTPLPFFGGAETHNTPRFGYGHLRKKKAAWLLFNLLPNAIPFLHNGFELHEQLPVNTGLNFTKQQIDFYSQLPLPLFYKNKLDWDTKNTLLPFLVSINELRKTHSWIFNKSSSKTPIRLTGKIIGVIIKHGKKEALALFNVDFYRKSNLRLHPGTHSEYLNLLAADTKDNTLPTVFSAGGVFLGIRK